MKRLSMEMHVGGLVSQGKSFEYIGGRVCKYGNVDCDLMGYFTLVAFCQDSGCSLRKMWYALPDGTVKEIFSDNDVLEMCDAYTDGSTVTIYCEGILIEHGSENEAVDDLRKLFNRLREFKLRLNPAKCVFGATSGKLLGFLVSKRGIEVDPSFGANVGSAQGPTGLVSALRLAGVGGFTRFFSCPGVRLAEEALPHSHFCSSPKIQTLPPFPLPLLNRITVAPPPSLHSVVGSCASRSSTPTPTPLRPEVEAPGAFVLTVTPVGSTVPRACSKEL
ncbi:hypothetical protein MLD38_017057 [Melastoma candidum]|uniref:Uncharacterized protein n=1 Tax=Melastoma candidum TaxID=119954 RepID=A0ACB9QQN7_9MYRT|nr:hypothetical protein MLD38_017057 [Melastoma candidum]